MTTERHTPELTAESRDMVIEWLSDQTAEIDNAELAGAIDSLLEDLLIAEKEAKEATPEHEAELGEVAPPTTEHRYSRPVVLTPAELNSLDANAWEALQISVVCDDGETRPLDQVELLYGQAWTIAGAVAGEQS